MRTPETIAPIKAERATPERIPPHILPIFSSPKIEDVSSLEPTKINASPATCKNLKRRTELKPFEKTISMLPVPERKSPMEYNFFPFIPISESLLVKRPQKERKNMESPRTIPVYDSLRPGPFLKKIASALVSAPKCNP